MAVLVPLRGAVAAVAVCPGVAGHAGIGMHMKERHLMGGAEELGLAAAEHCHGSHHDQDRADKCNLCSACCTAAPMTPTFTLTLAPVDVPSSGFPLTAAAVLAFISEGQERPPRST